MFDGSVPAGAALAHADDATLVAAIGGWARVEAAASARRLAAIAELVARRVQGGSPERGRWSCDNWDAMAAEVAAAQGISHGMALGQMYLGVALRDRLPLVGALFAEGTIGARLVATIVWHTELIKDPEILRLVDKALAEDAARFGPLSANKTSQAIEALVDRYDPGALRRTRANARSRDVVIDCANQQAGTAALWGRLFATDAAVLDRRLTQMAHGVCEDDPRTTAQRRADALGALAGGAERLACCCGNADCPVGAGGHERAAGVVIHVVAEASALDTRPDPHISGEPPTPRPITRDTPLAEALAADPEPDPPVGGSTPAAVLTTGGVIPNSLLAELIRSGAKLRPVCHPGEAVAPEAGYRPSAALERFTRCRDMTCRFPNCDRPAEFCDVDHTIPWPLGPTHPSNLKCLCKKHHLLKTFWTGVNGWSDQQLPDGTIIWTSPSGHTYTTRPASRLLFPALCLPTGELPATPTVYQPPRDRGIMMPKRRRTREHDRARRIDAERALNAAHIAERNHPPPF
ncbi:DUF222 domain-containing protein [Mycobacterium sp. SM1]|uniref:HNH endonuclease signature motif containing protein n=1 Tax=Mycobacterium sp. SM1 TaxID=2816243 RepID=UPI001BD01129|nr:HNH endonuclease signature motif containing protein [Mycobacterium sp. SM1]MBS4729279.1 DUF222 domain-containing protein [Mycobacterium sp. SM1]